MAVTSRGRPRTDWYKVDQPVNPNIDRNEWMRVKGQYLYLWKEQQLRTSQLAKMLGYRQGSIFNHLRGTALPEPDRRELLDKIVAHYRAPEGNRPPLPPAPRRTRRSGKRTRNRNNGTGPHTATVSTTAQPGSSSLLGALAHMETELSALQGELGGIQKQITDVVGRMGRLKQSLSR